MQNCSKMCLQFCGNPSWFLHWRSSTFVSIPAGIVHSGFPFPLYSSNPLPPCAQYRYYRAQHKMSLTIVSFACSANSSVTAVIKLLKTISESKQFYKTHNCSNIIHPEEYRTHNLNASFLQHLLHTFDTHYQQCFCLHIRLLQVQKKCHRYTSHSMMMALWKNMHYCIVHHM